MARPLHASAKLPLQTFEPLSTICLTCGNAAHIAYHTQRTITTLTGRYRLHLAVRRCISPQCPRYHLPYRPEAEGAWALPHGEYGLDVMALVGALRYQQHQSLTEIHHSLNARGLSIGERTVLNLLARYEELVTIHMTDRERLQSLVQKQGSLMLAVDGLRPDVGHEVLWVIRDCVSLTAPLQHMIATFLKVTASYRPGLFHCYDVADLPRTNNDLEHVFGSTRYHERRATGRKQASPGLVVRGSVRIVAAIATQNYHFSGPDLAPRDLMQWRTLRKQVDYRHEARREHSRFRKDPERYLHALEELLSQRKMRS